eukprot:SM000035S13110  [mRNA]  locus=s35:433375:434667:+ [translate_table: standard]
MSKYVEGQSFGAQIYTFLRWKSGIKGRLSLLRVVHQQVQTTLSTLRCDLHTYPQISERGFVIESCRGGHQEGLGQFGDDFVDEVPAHLQDSFTKSLSLIRCRECHLHLLTHHSQQGKPALDATLPPQECVNLSPKALSFNIFRHQPLDATSTISQLGRRRPTQYQLRPALKSSSLFYGHVPTTRFSQVETIKKQISCKASANDVEEGLLAPLPTTGDRFVDFRAAVMKRRLYVMGGQSVNLHAQRANDRYSLTDEVWIYDVTTSHWVLGK